MVLFPVGIERISRLVSRHTNRLVRSQSNEKEGTHQFYPPRLCKTSEFGFWKQRQTTIQTASQLIPAIASTIHFHFGAGRLYLLPTQRQNVMTADGFDNVSDDLEELSENVQELEGENEVAWDELYNKRFMKNHTSFSSLQEFLAHSPWDADSVDELLKRAPQDEIDEYVDKYTRFPNEERMKKNAGEEWTARQLGL